MHVTYASLAAPRRSNTNVDKDISPDVSADPGAGPSVDLGTDLGADLGVDLNEDYVVAGPDWWFVLDGATAPPGVDSGCVHSVRWLVERLAAATARGLTIGTDPLPEVLAEAIRTVRSEHGGRCDLDNPDSPSATASLLRCNGDTLEYLVLADSPILLDARGGVRVVVDDRLDHLPDYSLAGVRAARNAEGGFWVAAAVPEAAYRAVTGTVPLAEVRAAAVLSDGASRYVERFRFADWSELMMLLRRYGPWDLIEQVRAAERRDETSAAPLPGKPYDDATALLVEFPSTIRAAISRAAIRPPR